MSSPTATKPVRIAIIGTIAPHPDGSPTRSGALAIALAAHANVAITVRAIAPDEATCAAIADAFANRGNAIHSQVTTRADGDPAPIRLGDTLDIWGLFAHDLVILDADDAPLRAWLTDLPAHTAPNVRLLGTLDYVTSPLAAREKEIDLRFDALFGTVEQVRTLFGLHETLEPDPDSESVDAALVAALGVAATRAASTDRVATLSDSAVGTAEAIGAMMPGANLRTAAIHDDSTLAIAALNEPVVMIPLPECASREAIIAAVAIAMARRAPWPSVANLLQP